MPALLHDVTIEIGADWQREFTVTNADGSDIPGFSGYTPGGVFRTNAGTTPVVAAITITGPRTIKIALTGVQTGTLPAGTSFTHNYLVTAQAPGNGITYRIAQGSAVISGGA